MTKYAKQTMATAPDEERTMTLAEVRALPGLLGRIASAMVATHGVYGYTDAATGRTVRIVLAK